MMKEVKMMKEMAIQMAKELSRKMGSKLEMFKLRTSGVAKAYWDDAALVHKNASIATTAYVVHATVQATVTSLSKGDKEALLSVTTEAKELRSKLMENTAALTSLCAEVQALRTLLSSRRSNVQEAKKTGVRKLLAHCWPPSFHHVTELFRPPSFQFFLIYVLAPFLQANETCNLHFVKLIKWLLISGITLTLGRLVKKPVLAFPWSQLSNKLLKEIIHSEAI